METLKYIAIMLANKRKQLGLTRKELAEDIGVSCTTIEFIEQGRRYPSLAMLIHICKRLKLKIEVSDL